MIIILLIFFAVTAFDWIELIKEKRKSEIIEYVVISILVVIGIYAGYKTKFNNSIAGFIFDKFNI